MSQMTSKLPSLTEMCAGSPVKKELRTIPSRTCRSLIRRPTICEAPNTLKILRAVSFAAGAAVKPAPGFGWMLCT